MKAAQPAGIIKIIVVVIIIPRIVVGYLRIETPQETRSLICFYAQIRCFQPSKTQLSMTKADTEPRDPDDYPNLFHS